MSKQTGGPAFPNVPSDVQYEQWDEGMTLRDYFAAKALCGDWASQSSSTGEFPTSAEIDPLTKRAEIYYRMADAMLKARGE